jgi:hypothetical protein
LSTAVLSEPLVHAHTNTHTHTHTQAHKHRHTDTQTHKQCVANVCVCVWLCVINMRGISACLRVGGSGDVAARRPKETYYRGKRDPP